LAGQRIAFEEQPHGELFLDTAGGLEVYRRGRSSKFWSNARNRARRLAAAGTVEFERARTPYSLVSALEEAFGVSLRSWKGRRGTAIGMQEEFRAFFRALARRFGDVGDCEVSLLRLNGGTIAYRIGLRHKGLYLECDIAFDEAHRSCSPGTLLGVQSNEALIAEGTSEINLGMAFSWKGEWSPSRRERLEWVVYPRHRPYALALRGARHLQRRVLRTRPPQS
jgi:CelD/BcsL family acetyltransferase involved in cellulose biosynthesis